MLSGFYKAVCPAAALVLLLQISPVKALSRPSWERTVASPQDASTFTLDGRITEAEAGKLTINTEANILFHVLYNDKTEIKRADGSAGSVKDLRVGAQIHVVGDLEESGDITAAKITLKGKDSR